MPNVSVTATRHGLTLAQAERFRTIIRALYWAEKDNVWHDGDCVGGDDETHKIVFELKMELVRGSMPGIHMVGHPGDTPHYYASNVFDESREPKPNKDRNHDMVDECQVLVACPRRMHEEQRSGTWMTIRYCKKLIRGGARKTLMIIWPDGSTEVIQ